MIVEDGKELSFYFSYHRSVRAIWRPAKILSPNGLENNPTYFCTGTEESARILFKCLLALTFTAGISVIHRYESYYQ
jgi:hypothetical protein